MSGSVVGSGLLPEEFQEMDEKVVIFG